MTRHIVGPAGLTMLGIALVFTILFQLAASQVTVFQPQSGGVYVEGVLGYASVVNPILTYGSGQANSVSEDVAALVFEGLTTLDDRQRPGPALASSWAMNDDGSAVEFQLRSGVSWHDGAPFTVDDVLFTVQAIQDPRFQGDPALQALWQSVIAERVDDYRVRFVLQEPFPSFLYYTTIGILPAHLLSNVAAADLPSSPFSTSKPVGTGPFRLESLSPDRIVLLANATYWGQRPYLSQVELWSFGDEDSLLASYGRGEIDGFRVTSSATLSQAAQLSGLHLLSAERAGYGAVFLNLARETASFFQVLEVRQAMLYALDRQAMIDEALAGQALVASSPLPPMLWAHDPTVRQYGYDPVRAAGLLDSSGWLDSDADRIRDREGTPLRFELLVGPGLAAQQLAHELVQAWGAIGLDVAIRQATADELDALLDSRDYDAVLAEVALSADPDPYPLWHSTQAALPGQNITGFVDEVADLAMEEARTTSDLETQSAAFGAFQRQFAEQAPALLLYYPVTTYAVDSRVQGVQLGPLQRASDRFRNIVAWYREVSERVVIGDALLDSP
ncbi:MAG TPA: ABC transporter substrate-binding protein [Anaerolineae bacterium]|nr:ABC transporter substrate-binding protein [Anaerolineae bacterium]